MTFQTLIRIVCVALFIPASIANAQDKPLPGKVDLGPEFRKQGLLPRAQGRRDSCSLFAITAVADFEQRRKSPGPHRRLSEEFLIWAANESTGRLGDQAMFYEAVHGLNTLGVCPDELLHYENEGLKQAPSAEILAAAKDLSGRWRVEWLKRWDVRQPLTDAELWAIKKSLADGHPVACGLRWPKKQHGPDLLDVPPPGGVFDGHSIVFTGYADNSSQPGGGAFIFRNSNGPQWGKQGYGLISYGYARAYANDALILHCGKPGSEVPTVRHEAESLTILSSFHCHATPQKMDGFGGPMWSQSEQLFCRAEKGGHVELSFDVTKAGRYRIRLLATAGPDFGAIQAQLNGAKLDSTFDLYSGRVSPSGSLELGSHELSMGKQTLHVRSVYNNPASTNFRFGLDALDLIQE